MSSSNSALESLSSADLLTATRDLVGKSRGVEADLLIHLGEIDQRRIYLEQAFPSMFAFCVQERHRPRQRCRQSRCCSGRSADL